MNAPFTFALPPELAAREPPERRGLARDGVRLLVLDRHTGRVEHTCFRRLGSYLRPGDLLVFNSSRTLPAVLDGRTSPSGPDVEVRLAEHLPDDSWLALILCRGESRLISAAGSPPSSASETGWSHDSGVSAFPHAELS
jgi:S-adenosylmethionine:tRNA ribosyltransferase-isomerase